MQLINIKSTPISQSLTTGQMRQGLKITLIGENGLQAHGEASPLSGWSQETVEQVNAQLESVKSQLLKHHWNLKTFFDDLLNLKLLPSLSFALESALLELLDPLPPSKSNVSALLMGTEQEILQQAALRAKEGYVSAKVKVNNLSLSTAKQVIDQLKNTFKLRIDVNRAWNTSQAISFFEQYPKDAFDYVEEPFQDPNQLNQFTHPLAVDESYPNPLNLTQLEQIPALTTIVYKPTLQGGMAHCLPLQNWAASRKILLVLSSAFESPLGLDQISAMAQRMKITTPLGLGTIHFLQK